MGVRKSQRIQKRKAALGTIFKAISQLGPHNRGNPAQKEDRSGLEKIGCARKKGYVDTYLTLFFARLNCL
jgi:hypothetical protein